MEQSVQMDGTPMLVRVYLMTMDPTNELIHDGQSFGLPLTILLAHCIIEIVGVNDTHNMLELVGPPLAAVVPA